MGIWKKIVFIIGVFVIVVSFYNCTPKPNSNLPSDNLDPWDQPLGPPIPALYSDGWQDLHELPEPVNRIGGWTDSIMATPDGKGLLFSYSTFDFFKLMMGQGFIISDGTRRTGMSVDGFQIFQATLTKAGWDVSYHSINTPNANAGESSANINESGDILVWTRWNQQTLGTGADIYFATKSNGVWSSPSLAPLNSNCDDDNAHVVGTMVSGTIFFESTRDKAGGSTCIGKKNIYYATYNAGVFSTAQLVQGIDVATEEEQQVWVTPNLQQIYWTSGGSDYGISVADLQSDGSYANKRVILRSLATAGSTAGKMVFLGEATVVETSRGQLLYLMCAIALNENNQHTWNDSDNIKIRPCVMRKPK